MTLRTLYLALIFLPVFFVSCQNAELLDETRSFSNHKWMRFEPEEFTAHVNSTDDCFNIYLTATIDTALFRGDALPMTINLYSPSGERRMFRYDLHFKNKKDGKWLGEWHGDQLSVTRCVRQFFFFNSVGEFKLELAQCTSRYELEGVSQVGLRIVKAELKYPK
ncbi:MAG: hypothetical protein IJ764_04350 [Bacteroidales bacterium]|nr:hypothetical protein [Bacteroidales bacterium]